MCGVWRGFVIDFVWNFLFRVRSRYLNRLLKDVAGFLNEFCMYRCVLGFDLVWEEELRMVFWRR